MSSNFHSFFSNYGQSKKKKDRIGYCRGWPTKGGQRIQQRWSPQDFWSNQLRFWDSRSIHRDECIWIDSKELTHSISRHYNRFSLIAFKMRKETPFIWVEIQEQEKHCVWRKYWINYVTWYHPYALYPPYDRAWCLFRKNSLMMSSGWMQWSVSQEMYATILNYATLLDRRSMRFLQANWRQNSFHQKMSRSGFSTISPSSTRGTTSSIRPSKPLIPSSILCIDEIDNLLHFRDSEDLYRFFELPFISVSHLILVGISNTVDLIETNLPLLKTKNCISTQFVMIHSVSTKDRGIQELLEGRPFEHHSAANRALLFLIASRLSAVHSSSTSIVLSKSRIFSILKTHTLGTIWRC